MSEVRSRSECMGNDRAAQIPLHLAELSTEELQDKLAELILDESEADGDTVALIDAYLAELEKKDPCENTMTAEESLGRFHTKFPTLFENPPKSKAEKGRRPHPIRYGVMAAVIIVLICGFAVQAMGGNVIGVIARWTSEAFSLTFPGYEDTAPSIERNDAYTELQGALDAYGITTPLVPRYLPEGFEQIELSIKDKGSLIMAVYQQGECLITIQIRATGYETTATLEKDADAPETYTVANVDHHIMTNTGTYSAAWENGEYECEILNVPSRELLYDIIDSIYMG